jgi:N-acetylglucosamine kinase-like BadF-type ATPase
MGSLLLGVDGGNTKTVALVVERDGTVAGSGRGGCGDIHNAGSTEPALIEIVRAVTSALDAAGARAEDLAGCAFSLAGADWPEDFSFLRGELQSRLALREPPEIVNDALGGLRCGTDDMVGVAAVVGTYAAVGARNARGELFHLGFWPDSTGAFALGSQALAAVWRHMLGLGPETSLLGRALERWECADAEDLLHAFTRVGGIGKGESGLFADAVLDEAEAGDAVAHEIVVRVAGVIGDYARVCAARTSQLGAPFTLVLCGGVLRHRSPLLRAAILDRVTDAQPVFPRLDPVAGAVLIAADRAGARPDSEHLRWQLAGSPAGQV